MFTGSFKYCQSEYEAALVNLFYPFLLLHSFNDILDFGNFAILILH